MRILMLVLILLLVFFQYKLWVEKQGLSQIVRLQNQLAEITAKNTELEKQNDQLQVKVDACKKNTSAYEARAREELGMVKKGEVFYQVVPKAKKTQSETARGTTQ